MIMTVSDVKKEISDRLVPAVGADEANAMTRVILEDVLRLTPVDIALHPERTVEDFTVSRLKDIVARVVGGEPLQYVLGHAMFMGLDLKVSPAVLIPRPETGQLVDMITDRFGTKQDLSVLDLCTGSGCIAIALGRALPFAHVRAVDNSVAALAVAEDNASRLQVKVDFTLEDVLRLQDASEPLYDIIVSNPPYVAESERKDMDSRVLDHEPSAALFVPDDNPLVFYRAISHYALTSLKSSGTLYFEINPLFADALHDELLSDGWSDVVVLRDYKGLNRFAVCQR